MRASDFLVTSGMEPNQGPWKETETICLMVCKEVLNGCYNVEDSFANIAALYRHVAMSNAAIGIRLLIGAKNNAQIAAKLSFLEKKFRSQAYQY